MLWLSKVSVFSCHLLLIRPRRDSQGQEKQGEENYEGLREAALAQPHIPVAQGLATGRRWHVHSKGVITQSI